VEIRPFWHFTDVGATRPIKPALITRWDSQHSRAVLVDIFFGGGPIVGVGNGMWYGRLYPSVIKSSVEIWGLGVRPQPQSRNAAAGSPSKWRTVSQNSQFLLAAIASDYGVHHKGTARLSSPEWLIKHANSLRAKELALD